jgi:hypothetical protein
MVKCKFCDENASYGNKSIYRNREVDIYIVGKMLYILKIGKANADKVSIRFCPQCGRKL